MEAIYSGVYSTRRRGPTCLPSARRCSALAHSRPRSRACGCSGARRTGASCRTGPARRRPSPRPPRDAPTAHVDPADVVAVHVVDRRRHVRGRGQPDRVLDQPDARIEEDFAELQRAVEQLEVERLQRLAEIERRRLFERDGHLSAASWLATTFKEAWGTAPEHGGGARGRGGERAAR